MEVQHPISSFARVATKGLVLLLGWLIASLAPLAAIALWKSYGGSIYVPELVTVFFGHLINASLTIALAFAAASFTANPSTAAIVTLAVTVGSWILSFIGAVQGGLWERAAGYTPTAFVAEFQHGLVRLDAVTVAFALVLTGLGVAAIWLRPGIAVRRRACESIALFGGAAIVIFACTFANLSHDFSENRMNSFSIADERALRQIKTPLRIEVHLAPEDPRRADLDRRALSKLWRVMPKLQIDYVSSTSIGMFEQTNPNYGEIWYEMGGRKSVSRVTTQAGVLESVYSLAGISQPDNDSDIFRGHPLAVPAKGAPFVFYAMWPTLVVGAGFLSRRSRS
jgi:hypothetical protein